MASILETFMFLFEADTKKVQAGLDSGKKAADELEKGLNKTDETAKKLSNSFIEMAKGVAGTVAAMATLGYLKGIAEHSADQTEELRKESRQLRVNAEDLYTWQNAIKASGGSAEGLHKTLEMLSQRTRDPLGALERVADRFKGVSDLRADRMGAMLGLDAGTVQAMRQGRQGLIDLLEHERALGTVTKEQIEIGRKYAAQLRDTNLVIEDVKRNVASEILPIMTEWLRVMEKLLMWMRDKSPFIISFFTAIATIVTAIYLPAIRRAVLATYALIAPYALLVLGVLALAAVIGLVADDIVRYMQGNKSMIGDLLERFPKLKDAVKSIGEAWQWLKDEVGPIIDFIIAAVKKLVDFHEEAFGAIANSVVNPIGAFEDLRDKAVAALDAIGKKYPWLSSLTDALKNTLTAAGLDINGVWDSLATTLERVLEVFKHIADAVGSAVQQIGVMKGFGNISDFADKNIGDALTAGKNWVLGTNTPAASMSSSAISNSSKNSSSSTNVNIGDISINAPQATNSEDIAKGITQSLQEHISSANDEFDDGVVA